ncbi:MAG: YcxB-like protein [Gemmatimonadetes bacterium]|nr:YcxB-like protein [Gemmatimonadota bacterium]
MEFDFEYENTPALHGRVVAAISRHARVTRRLWWLVFGLPVVMTLSKALVEGNRTSVAVFLGVVAPWWIIYPALFWLFLKWSTRRVAARSIQQDATHQGLQSRRLDDAGLHIRNAVLSADVSWGALQSAVETPEFFLIFQNPGCGYALPKAALVGAEPADVRSFLASKLHDKAKLGAD